jgi:hypothetical protein
MQGLAIVLLVIGLAWLLSTILLWCTGNGSAPSAYEVVSTINEENKRSYMEKRDEFMKGCPTCADGTTDASLGLRFRDNKADAQ